MPALMQATSTRRAKRFHLLPEFLDAFGRGQIDGWPR